METRDNLIKRLKPLVNDVNLWKAFQEYLEYHEAAHFNTLSQSDDMTMIYRIQGRQEFLKMLKNLRTTVGNT